MALVSSVERPAGAGGKRSSLEEVLAARSLPLTRRERQTVDLRPADRYGAQEPLAKVPDGTRVSDREWVMNEAPLDRGNSPPR